MRRAFKIGYLADGFFGYAPQPGRSTVHGLLEQELSRRNLLEPGTKLLTASRTDRGVHALGNVIAFDTPLKGEPVARVLNVLDPRIFCFGYADVPPDFNPRHAESRSYRYLLDGEGHDPKKWVAAAREFVGEHDFTSFSRRDDPPKETRRFLSRLAVTSRGRFLQLDLVAPSFLWGQVRKIVAALLWVEEGRLSVGEVRAALQGRKRIHLPQAPPERLVLRDVSYGFRFSPVPGGASRRVERVERARSELELRASLLDLFKEAVIGGSPMPSAVRG